MPTGKYWASLRLVPIVILQLALCWPALGREAVCVDNASDALVRAVEFHRDLGHEILQMKDLPEHLELRVYRSTAEFVNAVPTYLARVPNSALVLYAADDDHVCAFMWLSGRTPAYAKIPITLEALNDLISDMRAAIAQGSPEDLKVASSQIEVLRAARSQYSAPPVRRATPLGLEALSDLKARLSNAIFPEAFRDSLSGIKHLTIVPLGAMTEMPIAILHPSSGDKRVVDLFSVNYLSFAGEVRDPNFEWNGSFQHPLIFGNPRGHDPYWSSLDLPNAEAEAESVAQLFGGNAIVREAAKLGVFYDDARNADLIYIAAHALADEQDPLRGSFIAFADGDLSAGSVKNMKLKAKLVVLSACQTGMGDVVRGGVIGFGRTFLDANAKNVVMTLWKVNDVATRRLMKEFTVRLSRMPPAEALREAQLATEVEFPKPVYWAGFGVYGNQAAFVETRR